jgi:hypothetical protein
VRVLLFLVVASTLLLGQTLKLYLKDGEYHSVREYKLEGDRVRYFSTERGEWEEIPVSLVDLNKTRREQRAGNDRSASDQRATQEEERAERDQQREIASIPMEPGAYYKVGERIEPLPSADYQVVTDKKRRTLQMLSPVPLIPGKATVVIKGERSRYSVDDERPSFYMRLAKEERFGIIRLAPRKDFRVVENISIVPVAKQAIEERKRMETFEQELASGLYRIWPEKPLTPGEYALIEFSEKEDVDDVELLVWDFAYHLPAK